VRHVRNLVRLARPSHWIKNVFVFAALVFARQETQGGVWVAALDPEAWWEAGKAFAAFCLASSAVYAVNDVVDRREDGAHPAKRSRPIASGSLSPAAGLVLAVVLVVAGLGVAATCRPPEGALAPDNRVPLPAVVAAYLGLMFVYSGLLKRLVILDVIVLAAGFVIRAYAGGVAIGVWVSPWLLLCTLTLSLFLGFAKRESERAALGGAAEGTRDVSWAVYDEKSLVHMMTVSAALAIVTYMLYTVSPETVERVGHQWMFLTVLPVVYAVFRFYNGAITGRATGPVEMVRRDPAFVAALVVWLAMVGVLLFVVDEGFLGYYGL